jgi:hypothetical protein
VNTDTDPSPANELAALLWVVAALIAVFELTWLFFSRIYAI